MNKPVTIRDAAARDLAEHADYLAERSMDAAIRFSRAAAQTFRDLAAMPQMGAPRAVQNPTLAGLRKWAVRGFLNYLVFYRPIEGGIEIVRVLHAARDIEHILEAMQE